VGLYFRHDLSLEHETGAHPENAERICAIERRMRAENFHGLEVREAPAAPEAAVEAVHPGGYRAEIERLADAGGGAIDADTVLSPRSYEAAMHAAGATFEAVDRALGDGVGFSFCALRPPGHHAEPDRPMGFCLFNNVAIGATHALDAHGAERVLILDWDVHHGNGTQAVFYDSSAVLLIGIHQMPLYPGSGLAAERGVGEGEGYTVNLPVAAGSGGEVYRELIEGEVEPRICEFEPDLILVSAGYDAHRADPLAGCELDTEDFGWMASAVGVAAAAAGAPVICSLEGGYAPEALAESVSATVRGFTAGR